MELEGENRLLDGTRNATKLTASAISSVVLGRKPVWGREGASPLGPRSAASAARGILREGSSPARAETRLRGSGQGLEPGPKGRAQPYNRQIHEFMPAPATAWTGVAERSFPKPTGIERSTPRCRQRRRRQHAVARKGRTKICGATTKRSDALARRRSAGSKPQFSLRPPATHAPSGARSALRFLPVSSSWRGGRASGWSIRFTAAHLAHESHRPV